MEVVNFWWNKMLDREIEETRGTISNEHLMELGYDGEDPNPHTGNIELLQRYISVLEAAKK